MKTTATKRNAPTILPFAPVSRKPGPDLAQPPLSALLATVGTTAVLTRIWPDRARPTCGGLCHESHACTFSHGSCVVVIPGGVGDDEALGYRRDAI